MSSTIFYRFRSQKDTSRVLFDGTGLTVFDLKREIIQDNKLGDGTDFQLRVYNPDTQDEYEDDAQVIPRSTTVIARRSPAAKTFSIHSRHKGGMAAAMGNATRYVTGRPRVFQQQQQQQPQQPKVAADSAVSGMTEEERIASMFATQENQWEQVQQEMSTATPVIHRPNPAGNNSGENDGPPPPGYMCYRCGSRNHWIKNCPTNTDPNFEGKRIRRTTGIPKKFLKSVEINPETMSAEEMAEKKIMVTDEGKFVVQVADEHSWEDYQRKIQNRLIDSNEAIYQPGHFKDLPDELKCSLTGGLLKQPVRTTKCCQKLASKKNIEDALLESDFVCPLCETEDVLLDSLVEDKEAQKNVEEFLETQKAKSEDNKRKQDDPSGNMDSKKQKTDAAEGESENGTGTNSVNASPEKAGGSSSSLPMPPVPPVPFGIPPFPMPFMPFMPPHQNQNQNQNQTQSKK
ncbi:cleavage polyadenylation factor subunit MPE1 [Nakaseomyces bracarensis]|uniref:cleavage polyadenylation factor subunit MPE1 n=1 Tax=Nakaseomyces bracarensis TaxID=273131 RepID=UPI003871D4EF